MIREEAIDIIKCLAWHTRPDEEDVEQAIKALDQQTCEDAVSRQAVLDIIMPYCKDDDGSVENTGDLRNALDDIESLSPVVPKEKTGKWIIEDMFDGDVAYRCSECNELFWIESGTPKDNEYNFCPNCGARMVSE